ncbi:uncharacterized protein LOC121534132 isoform X2 [Coregonus clupeaformis]|uniref:uncharacterized protein LOC121534132 isoform X2 n=1 Tax=Coregonus clupeaformis TaxID=59861 RepID=UPI001E1C8632|nr:uncharacterized protein LOC121534132 isoform X2 [Coregonus clupeaformis]
MERLQYYHCLLSYLLLALRDPALCAKEITVTPAKPIVKLGDAVTLTCETTCPQGRPRWMELDESDATVNTTENRSDLHIADVQLNHEGKYTCTAAKCRTQKKETIQLRVYTLPVPVLSTVPKNPVSGQPFEVKCTLTKVFHRDCDHFEMHLFHREKIEAELSKNCDDGRFCDYTQSSKDQMGTGNTDYQCEAKLTIGPQTFLEKAFLTIHFQDDADEDDDDPRSTVMSFGPVETQTPELVNKEGEGQDDADGDDDDPRSTVMSLTTLSVGPVETQTTEPVNKEGEGQDDADGDDDDPRSTVMSLTTLSVGPVETQTTEPVNKEGEGQDDADGDDDDPRSTVMSLITLSVGPVETETSEPVNKEGEGQDDADEDDDDPRSTVMSLTTLSVGPVETQTSEPVNKEGEGQDDADGDDDDPRSTVMSLTTLSVGPVETQTSEPVNKEGEGQDDADEDDDDPRSIVMSLIPLSVGPVETQTSEPVNKEGEGQALHQCDDGLTVFSSSGGLQRHHHGHGSTGLHSGIPSLSLLPGLPGSPNQTEETQFAPQWS